MACTSHSSTTSHTVRLFCFPFAGGGASVFFKWSQMLPGEIDLVPIQLPGREECFGQPLISDIDELVNHIILPIIRPQLDIPSVFYGHSMGAIVAYELARTLRRSGIKGPELCIVSGRVAPHLPSSRRLNDLPEDKLIHALKEFDGTPQSVLQNRELMDILIPIIRSDLAVTENYAYYEESPLNIPIVALGGLDDPIVSANALQDWRQHTSSSFETQLFDGGHFFNFKSPEVFLQIISEHIEKHISDKWKFKS